MKSHIRKIDDPGYGKLFPKLKRTQPVQLIKPIALNVDFDDEIGRYRATCEDVPLLERIGDTADDAIGMWLGVACIRYLSLSIMTPERCQQFGFAEQLKKLETYFK